jgi:hemolysin activation/secretion protein
VLEVIATSLPANTPVSTPIAIEQQVAVNVDDAQAIERFLQEAAPADVTATAKRALISNTSQRLTKVALTPTNALPTAQEFLQQRRNAAGPGPIVEAAPKPELAQSPTFTPRPQQTRTEVIEERIEESTQFRVNKIDVVGSTVFSAAELAVYTKPLEGREISLGELRKAVDDITKLYLSKGYINSRAFLGNQEVTDGNVTIQVLEGSVEDIKVEGNVKLPASYIIDRLTGGVTNPLRGDTLEEQLRLLQTDPAFEKVEASLSPGSDKGKSLLTVRVKEAKTAYFGLSSDNYSPPVVGSERYGIYGGLRSVFAPGDEFFSSYNRSTSGGSNVLDFLYKVPVNAKNGTVQLRVAPSWYEITDKEINAIFPSGIDGNSQLYDLTFRQPLVRTFRKEFALSLGFTLQNGNSSIGGTNLFDTESRARVLKFGQDFLTRDAQGLWSGRSSLNFGLDIFNATDLPDPLPDGQFFSWTGQIQRIQRFNANNVMIGQFDVQLSPDAILPSQQFIIGGGQSVRGFRQNARFGDNGIRFSLEHRTVVSRNGEGNAVIQLAPFFDMGTVWNDSDNPTPLNQKFLAGAGLGLILQPVKGLNMRFDYAVPFIRADEKNDNLQDKAFYFGLSYQP